MNGIENERRTLNVMLAPSPFGAIGSVTGSNWEQSLSTLGKSSKLIDYLALPGFCAKSSSYVFGSIALNFLSSTCALSGDPK